MNFESKKTSNLLSIADGISPVICRVLLGLVFLAGIWGGDVVFRQMESYHVDLLIDAEISAGNSFEVYTNDLALPPVAVSILPAERHVYLFKNVPGRVTLLRLDPTDVSGAEVKIYGIEFRRQGKTLLKLEPQRLSTWIAQGAVAKASDQPACFVFASTTNDPILTQKVKFDFIPGQIGKIITLINMVGDTAPVIAFIALWVAAALLRRHGRDRWRFVYIAAVCLGGFLLAWRVTSLSLVKGADIPAVHSAVGYAAYHGLEKAAELRGFWLSLVVVGFFAFSAIVIWRCLSRILATKEIEAGSPVADKFSLPFYLGGMAILALMTFPPLHYYLNTNEQLSHSLNFDVQNITTWDYFRHLGLIPFRDYWFPYGGFYYIQSPFFPDILLSWLHQLLYVGVYAGSVYRLLNYSKVRSLAICLLLLYLNQIGLVAGTERYFLSVGIVLLFAACIKENKLLPFLLWGGYLSYVFFMEANQLIYAAPGCLLLLGGALLLTKNARQRLAVLRHTMLGTFVLVLLGGAHLVNLARLGAMPEFLLFYRTMGDMTNYVMIPSNILNWFRMPYTQEGLCLSLLLVLFALSLWHLFARRSLAGRDIGDLVPLALSLLTCIAFQKQMLRPHVCTSMLGLTVTGLALLAARAENNGYRTGILPRIALCLGAGFLFSMFVIANGTARDLWQLYKSRLLALPQHVQTAFVDQSLWKKSENALYSPAAYSFDGIGGEELRSKLLERMKIGNNNDLFVLGDDSYLYTILKQAAPAHICLYSQSILYAQHNTVAWLEKHQPRYVLWRSSFKEFEIPNQVRVPLVYDHVMRNYVYLDQVGPFQILQRKQPAGTASMDLWRTHLGDTLAFGFIPSRSNPARFAVDKGGKGTVQTFLSVDILQPVHGREREFAFDIKGQMYRLKFLERKGVTSYNILLDRVWFLQLAKTVGIMPEMRPPLDDSMTYQVKEMNLSREVLY